MQPPQNVHPTPLREPAEFVVDSDQIGIVHKQLNGHIKAVRSDARLGLTLVTLRNVDKAAAAIAEQRAAKKLGSLLRPGTQPPTEPLECLLADLRVLFGARFGNWFPSMGKNRILHGVQLSPYPYAKGSDIKMVPWEEGQATYARAASAATRANKGHGVEVGVLDTRVYDHPALAGKYLAGSATILRRRRRSRIWWAGHATSVAGRIAQEAPGAALRIGSVLRGDATASVWDVARKLVQFADSGVDILNLSFGCHTDDGEPPLVLSRAIQRLTPTMVVVAAAGNHGHPPATQPAGELPQPETPLWPAAFDDVVAVGATDRKGRPARFTPGPKGSPVGADGRRLVAPWIDLLAPGVSVLAPYLEGTVTVTDVNATSRTESFEGWATWSGTSFAAAAVSGALAALTIPGRRTATEALRQLRNPVDETVRRSFAISLP